MDEVFTVADASSSRSTPSLLSSSSIGTNLPLLSAFLAFAIAQFLKLFTTWFKEKRWDSRRLYGSGGMPSSHSATVTALAVAIGLQEGIGGSSFALAVVLAAIVMYDASGVRLHAGQQAVERQTGRVIGKGSKHGRLFLLDMGQPSLFASSVLNQIVCELPPEHPLSNVRPLRELLGHTPLQVVAGAVLGCIVSFLMRNS